MRIIKTLILKFAFIAAFLGVLIPHLSYADKVLFFTPTRVLLDNSDPVEVMNITNLSDITRAYKISFQDLVMTYDGITTPVDSFEYSAKRMMRFVPREFILKPGERQTVRIMSRVSGQAPAGEYHTHIRFLEDVTQRDALNPRAQPQGTVISAPLSYEALIPAIVSHGQVDTTIGLKEASISKDQATGKFNAKLILTRQGNGQGVAYVDTEYTAPGAEPVSVTPRRTVYIYREIDERVKDIDFMLPEGIAPGGTIKLSVYDSPEKDAAPVTEKTLSLP